MRDLLIILVSLFLIAGSGVSAYAVTPEEVLSDPMLESRARTLSTKLRCLVCQNQSIDDSDAPLAKDLRVLLRKRLVAGDSDTQVIDYLVSRYGEFVLLQPKISLKTVLLWAAPAGLIFLGSLMLLFNYRKRDRTAPVSNAKLSKDEERRITKILGEGD